MSRSIRGLTGLAWVAPVVWVVPALAEDEAPRTVTTSWARMFLWSDDPLGMVIIVFLLVMSAVMLGLLIKLILDYRHGRVLPEETRRQLKSMLEERRYREAINYTKMDPSYLAKVVGAGLAEASNGFAAMERAVEEVSDAETNRMFRPIEYLNVMGNIAPMIGLFGTVYGMIVAFEKLVEAGGKPDPSQLASGISTALVTTFWGLVVAVPALAGYALIRNKVDAMASEGLIMAEELIQPFKPAARKASGSGSSSRPRATPMPVEGR